jgi:diguanylate cyclase (GGDEF)-like protein/PAS domain S-box-containing protein
MMVEQWKRWRLAMMSLQAKLLLCFVALTLAVTTLVLSAAWKGGRDSGEQLAIQLVDQMSQGIATQTRDYTQEAELIGSAAVAAFHTGYVEHTNPLSLEKYFWETSNVSRLASYIYVGTESGLFVGVERQINPTARIFSRMRLADDSMLRSYEIKAPGDRAQPVLAQTVVYDPRIRPWYVRVKQERKPIWTEPYLSASKGILVLTYAIPLVDQAGEFIGALGIDFTLAHLNEFLAQLKPSANGASYLLSPSGALIAASPNRLSSSSNPQTVPNEILNAVKAVRESATPHRQWISDDTIFGIQNLDGAIKGTIVVSIPTHDIWANKTSALWRSLAWAMLAMSTAILLGMLLLRSVVSDINQLTTTAEAFTAGSHFVSLPMQRSDEIGRLARAFARMAQRVTAELDSARTQIATEHSIALAEERKVAEQKADLARTRAQVRRLATVVESAHEPIAILRPDFYFEYANPAFTSQLGYPLAAIENMSLGQLLDDSQPEVHLQRLRTAFHAERVVRDTILVRRHHAPSIYMEFTLSPVHNDVGDLIEIALIGRDVSVSVAQRNLLSREAKIDATTKLMRREAFIEGTKQLMQTADRISLLFVDLDGFKRVNDVLGHAAGDDILQRVGEIILRNKRESDLASRYGGDEFVVAIVDDADDHVAHLVADRLIEAITRVTATLPVDTKLSASIGIASAPGKSTQFEALIQLADQAMYIAKRDGGNQKVIWNDIDVDQLSG